MKSTDMKLIRKNKKHVFLLVYCIAAMNLTYADIMVKGNDGFVIVF